MANNFEYTPLDDILNGKTIAINTPLTKIVHHLTLLQQEMLASAPSFDFMTDVCLKLISIIPIPIHIYRDGFILRARPNGNKPYSNLKELTYNSTNKKAISPGRFNLIEEAMFYGSAPIEGPNISGQFGCMFESSKDIFDNEAIWSGKAFAVGKFNVIKPINLIVLGFYDDALRKSPHMRNICQPFDIIEEKAYSKLDILKCRLFNTFFSGMEGRKNELDKTYLITTAFYHAIRRFYGSDIGILYSSSTTENYGINIVMTPELADNNLKLDSVVQFDMERNPKNYFNIKGQPTLYGKADDDGNFELETITDISSIK